MADKRNPLIPDSPSAEFYRVDEDQGNVFTCDEPFDLFEDWLGLARDKELNDANAMSLATIDQSGMPDVRVVLLKDVSPDGLSFYTDTLSAKGRALEANGVAALCFHWKSIRRQVRFRGHVERVGADEADAYFATRARGAQIGANVSRQSQVLASPDTLKEEIAKAEKRFEGQDVPRPEHWSGYLLKPLQIEFWVNRPFRLHDRLLFSRESETDQWQTDHLYP